MGSIAENIKIIEERIIREQKTGLEELADALLSRETLVDDEVRQILGVSKEIRN